MKIPKSFPPRLYQFFRDLPYVLSALITALAIAWVILAQFNFSYGVWHDMGGIGKAIDEYGAQNRYKEGFHLTSKAQREALFEQINEAIHLDGRGLADITFTVEGYPEQTLLTKPEVVHLQDVAHLVTIGGWLAIIGCIVWLSYLVLFAMQRMRPPPVKRQLITVGGMALAVLVILLCVGPTKVFYWLHEVLFPAGNQWFFYYQESLMSTMMHAPRLFGYIAVEWSVLGGLILVLMHFGVAQMSRRMKEERTRAPKRPR